MSIRAQSRTMIILIINRFRLRSTRQSYFFLTFKTASFNFIKFHSQLEKNKALIDDIIYSIPIAITINPIIRDNALIPEAPRNLTIK